MACQSIDRCHYHNAHALGCKVKIIIFHNNYHNSLSGGGQWAV